MVRMKDTGGISEVSLSHVTSGTYQREIISQTGLTFAAGTEAEVTAIAANVIADDAKDALFSWVRVSFVLYSTAEEMVYEWALIRCDKDDATQDLNDSPTVELLQKEGRILKRGMATVPVPSNSPVRWQRFSVYQVQLFDDEELRLLIRPITGSSAATGRIYGLLEWREVGA